MGIYKCDGTSFIVVMSPERWVGCPLLFFWRRSILYIIHSIESLSWDL